MLLLQTLLLSAQLSTVLALPTKPQLLNGRDLMTGAYAILTPKAVPQPFVQSSKSNADGIPANPANTGNATARVIEAGGKNKTSNVVEPCSGGVTDNMPAAKLLDAVNKAADDLQTALCVRFRKRDSALEERSGKGNETLKEVQPCSKGEATDNMPSAKSVDELATDLQAALNVYSTAVKGESALEERTVEVNERREAVKRASTDFFLREVTDGSCNPPPVGFST